MTKDKNNAVVASGFGFGDCEDAIAGQELMGYEFPTLAVADSQEKVTKLSATKVLPWTKGVRVGGFYAGTKIIQSPRFRTKDNPNGTFYLHRLVDNAGKQFGIWSSGVLRSFFLGDERGCELPQGVFVAMTYRGKIPHKTNPQGMHDFNIELKKDDMMKLLKPLKPIALVGEAIPQLEEAKSF
jgi:hypothetical protein